MAVTKRKKLPAIFIGYGNPLLRTCQCWNIPCPKRIQEDQTGILGEWDGPAGWLSIRFERQKMMPDVGWSFYRPRLRPAWLV